MKDRSGCLLIKAKRPNTTQDPRAKTQKDVWIMGSRIVDDFVIYEFQDLVRRPIFQNLKVIFADSLITQLDSGIMSPVDCIIRRLSLTD